MRRIWSAYFSSCANTPANSAAAADVNRAAETFGKIEGSDPDPALPFMTFSQDPLLFDERRTGRQQTCDHLVVAGWHVGAKVPVASVKLFNIRYRVRFAVSSSMVWREIGSGHHFNINTLRIEPIQIVDLQL